MVQCQSIEIISQFPSFLFSLFFSKSSHNLISLISFLSTNHYFPNNPLLQFLIFFFSFFRHWQVVFAFAFLGSFKRHRVSFSKKLKAGKIKNTSGRPPLLQSHERIGSPLGTCRSRRQDWPGISRNFRPAIQLKESH